MNGWETAILEFVENPTDGMQSIKPSVINKNRACCTLIHIFRPVFIIFLRTTTVYAFPWEKDGEPRGSGRPCVHKVVNFFWCILFLSLKTSWRVLIIIKLPQQDCTGYLAKGRAKDRNFPWRTASERNCRTNNQLFCGMSLKWMRWDKHVSPILLTVCCR